MARTGETTIKIQNNGVAVPGSFNTFDFVSGITAADGGGGIIDITASGSSGANIATEEIVATASGSNVTLDLTTLSHVIVTLEIVFRNGQRITPVTSWSVSGTTVTVFNADPTEEFAVQYTY